MKRIIRVFSLLLAAVMLLSAQALATEPAQAFTDVSKQDYFYDAVNWTVEKEITSGVSKDVFAPNRDCTRADFVTFLWRAAGKPEPSSTTSPPKLTAASYFAGMRRLNSVAVRAFTVRNSTRPPSSAGKGSRFITARFTAISAEK